MKRISLLALLVAASAVVGAETAMVHVENSGTPGFINERTIAAASAVEDGLMDYLFDAGHIVFTAGVAHGDAPALPFRGERASVRIAKAGGAVLLLEVGLAALSVDDPYPSEAVYVLTDIVADRVLSRGAIDLPPIASDLARRKGRVDPLEVCGALGAKVAAEAFRTAR